jgi:uncharacterized protein YdeI (YjbR/CyaY-like superfamily)
VPATELPIEFFASKRAFATWLAKNNAKSSGVRVKLAKKSAGVASLTYPEAVEVALCYGWIDGQANRLDDDYYLQRFTPRRPQSIWSKINREKAQALIDSGAMKPAGMREVERAQADGRWDAAYASPKNAAIPDELVAALRKNAKARKFFETLDSRNRYSIIHRIETAKKAETRARRVVQFVDMLAKGETIHPRTRE